MPRFIFYTATTLNGFLADESDSLAWLFAVGGDERPDFMSFIRNIGTTVMGSTTYEWVLREEKVHENPEKWAGMFGEGACFVFSSRELAVYGPNVRLVRGPVSEHLDEIRAAAGDKDVWVAGGGDLAGQFWDAGALDELQITFTPAAVPAGRPLFPRRVMPDRLELHDVERFGQFAHLTFRAR